MQPAMARVDWVDYAKGFCIVMVVMMHSVLGVEKAAGEASWAGHIVEFARPFRMPDFFMIAGLFLARVIDRDWRDYSDRKVAHFAYFYVLWVAINFALRGPGIVAEHGAAGLAGEFLLAFIEPFGTMWFIYLLPVFFLVTKLTRGLPWWLVWGAAAVLEIAPIHTGWMVPDEFAARFVYFYTGYILAPEIFRLAAAARERGWLAGLALVGWAVVNGGFVALGWADLPLVGLALGFLGAAAVVTLSALLSKTDLAAPLRYCGRHSLVIYLAFILFMGPVRILLMRSGLIPDLGTIGLLVTAISIAGSLALFWAVRWTPLRFLFERPAFARLEPKPALVPAE